MAASSFINVRKMRYTGAALSSLKNGSQHPSQPGESTKSPANLNAKDLARQHCMGKAAAGPTPKKDNVGRSIGDYPLTSDLAPWVVEAFTRYKPSSETVELVEPFLAELRETLDEERRNGTGYHDLDMVEATYRITLQVGAELLLAATENGDPVDLNVAFHSSRASRDDHFTPWGHLLTGLDCDPPIIAQFPVYLMMCQAFSFETLPPREDYVYSALTGVDWAKGKNVFSDSLRDFEVRARAAVPTLDDTLSGRDRSFWRAALVYLKAMNDCENARSDFTTPRRAAIKHGLDPDLIIAIRGIDTIGMAYQTTDGAAYIDDKGMDSLVGCALANDVMDLPTDIQTGETRNTIRLLYPDGLDMEQAKSIMSTLLSSMLCEIFRGHKRARFQGREDGRIAATSPSYSFCRARHRRIFQTLEAYVSRNPQFWDWTRDILMMAKAQITEAGLNEPLTNALKRAITQGKLPDSTPNHFYDTYFEMIEAGEDQMKKDQPLGVDKSLAPIVREIHHMWHTELLSDSKEPGWGQRFDQRSDELFGEAGRILFEKGQGKVTDEALKFGIAYGRLSMGLPYVAYHTVDAIIMARGLTVVEA